MQASMPTRHGGMLAKRASTWPRDHFCRSTIAPRSSWPTTWNEFLPISMPITAIALSNFWDMACSLSLAPLPSILSLVGQEHGRTIPLADSERGTGNALARRPIAIAPRWLSLFDHAAMRARPAPSVIIDCVTDDRMDYTEASEPLHDRKAVVVHIVPLGGLDVVPGESV